MDEYHVLVFFKKNYLTLDRLVVEWPGKGIRYSWLVVSNDKVHNNLAK